MYILKQYRRRNAVQLVGTLLSGILCLWLMIDAGGKGRFLIGHFFPNEQIMDRIQLDENLWRKNKQLSRHIPRYIHQIWISSIEKKSIYKRFEQAANTCQEFHQNYNYTLWTHDKLLHWLREEYPWFVEIYTNYRYDMQRIDAMKYFLLFHYGGMYIDLDVKCNADDLLKKMIPNDRRNDEPDVILHMGTEGIAANTDIMAAKRYHPIFKLAIEQLRQANRWFYLYHLSIILSAGPTFFYGIFRQYPWKERIYFIPNDELYGKLVGGVGGGTWMGKDAIVLMYFMDNKLRSIVFLCLFSLLFVYIFRWLKRKRYGLD